MPNLMISRQSRGDERKKIFHFAEQGVKRNFSKGNKAFLFLFMNKF